MKKSTHRIKVTGAERATIFEHLIQTFLDGRQLIGLCPSEKRYGEAW